MKKKKQGDFFDDYDNKDSALVINDGVVQPPTINPYLNTIVRKKPVQLSVDESMEGIIAGDTTI